MIKGIKEEINILVVDDRPENLVVMDGILESRNYSVIKANSGSEALGLMLEKEFAVVLLDVQMPEMDGFETAEFMKKSDRTRNIPIIFVTAINYDNKSISRGYDVGAVDYLFKPIDSMILRGKVDVFVNLNLQKAIIKQQAEMIEEKMQELLDLKEANWQLENLALIDELTGMPNRRNFNQYMNVQWGNCAFLKSPLSIVMIDIDNFKNYNDYYGHVRGDECLKEVSRGIMESLSRPLDMAFRFGGEEFTAVLPNTDLSGAEYTAEKIRHNIQNMKIEHKFSPIADVVTISLGVSTLIPQYKFLFHDFIESADKALYKAKSTGKNRVALMA